MDKLWTDAEVARVARMILDGLSRRKIAASVGLTRNAVIGRISRNDRLNALVQRPSKPGTARKRMRKESKFAGVLSAGPSTAIKRAEPGKTAPPAIRVYPLPPPAPPPPDIRLVSLTALAKDECKWPIDEDTKVVGLHRFCGRITGLGESYCDYHSRRAWSARQPLLRRAERE